jgi:hypothetical protein
MSAHPREFQPLDAGDKEILEARTELAQGRQQFVGHVHAVLQVEGAELGASFGPVGRNS